MFVHDETGRIVLVNQGMCRMFMCTPEQALTLTAVELSSNIPPYTQADAVAHVERALREGYCRLDWQSRRLERRRVLDGGLRLGRYTCSASRTSWRAYGKSSIARRWKKRYAPARSDFSHLSRPLDHVGVHRSCPRAHLGRQRGLAAGHGLTRDAVIGRTSG